MPVDKAMIQDKIDVIEKNLRFLSEYKTLKNNDFVKSYKDIQAVKYSLFEIIEACIDIAAHIISTKDLERAETYAEMFEILGKNTIIEKDLSNKLANMARFRNILVHSYAKVDNSKILLFVKEELDDVSHFIKSILKFIEDKTLNS